VKPAVAAKPATPPKPAPVAARPAAPAPAPAPVQAGRPMMTGPVVATPAPKKLSFKAGELVVYPAHGVGKIVMIEEQEIAGAKLELYIVDFEKEKLRLKVPTGRAEQKGMRRLSDKGQIEVALKVLKGRARIKRTMWSRRAQEYDAKINSGDLIAVSEVVRDLYRSERQPEQSYSERQLFEQALERMAREIAAVKKIDDDQAIKELEEYLAKNAKRPAGTEKAEDDVQADEAA
jgi:CarD family transcriptional regulator